MSTQPISAIKGSSGSSSSADQGDPQVQQLKYQINDWSTCPTTPPAMKKQIVAKLQNQLDSVEASLATHAKNVQAEKQASGQTSSTGQGSQTSQGNQTSQSGQKQPGQSRYISSFKFDTYV